MFSSASPSQSVWEFAARAIVPTKTRTEAARVTTVAVRRLVVIQRMIGR